MTELLDLAQKMASWARPGEEVEAFACWQRETEVRAYGGEVESLSSAESAGVGVRVVAQARQGFAYVGNLDESLAREALAEAHDNASFATPDANVGLASPDGIAPTEPRAVGRLTRSHGDGGEGRRWRSSSSARSAPAIRESVKS